MSRLSTVVGRNNRSAVFGSEVALTAPRGHYNHILNRPREKRRWCLCAPMPTTNKHRETETMGKFNVILASLAVAALTVIDPVNAAEPPESAKIDWKQFEGTTLDLLFVKHPWTTAIEPLLPEFEKLTGINLELTSVAEDAYWNKSTLGLGSKTPPFDVFFLSMGIGGYTAYTNNWLAQLNSQIENPKLTDPAWYKYDDFSPAAAAAFRLPDPSSPKIYGVP